MKSRKILTLLGSPKKDGSSSLLAHQVIAGAEAAGAENETYHLQGMDIKFCTGCRKCRTETAKSCVIEDDMQILYPKLRDADAIILASPIYWAHVTAQMKVFLDRCFALGGPQGRALFGKQFAIVLVYRDTDLLTSGTINAIRSFQDSFGSDIAGMIYGRAQKPGDIKYDEELMEKAFRLGEDLSNWKKTRVY